MNRKISVFSLTTTMKSAEEDRRICSPINIGNYIISGRLEIHKRIPSGSVSHNDNTGF